MGNFPLLINVNEIELFIQQTGIGGEKTQPSAVLL